MAYSPLPAWVMDALRKGWTPERIEGRLKAERPSDPRMRVSHECLHQWIYAKPQKALGPQAVPAERQTAPPQSQGQEVEGAAHPDARTYRRQTQTRGPAPRVRPLRVRHGRRRVPVETPH